MGEKIKGLIRGYEIKWTITVVPAGGEPHFWDIDSFPLAGLTYDWRPGDPEWAPSAVVLYSAIYDMAGNLVGGFDLDPARRRMPSRSGRPPGVRASRARSEPR